MERSGELESELTPTLILASNIPSSSPSICMEYRRLGKTDLRVSAIGLGCSRFGSVGQAGGDEAALRLVGQALDAGINFFDTSDIYGQGASETLLGKAL